VQRAVALFLDAVGGHSGCKLGRPTVDPKLRGRSDVVHAIGNVNTECLYSFVKPLSGSILSEIVTNTSQKPW
jgi:hypothetical protein